MAERRYPLLPGRRRRLRLPRPPRLRRGQAVALAVLLLATLLAAWLALRPPPRADPVVALRDARTAYGLGNYSAARNHALAALASRPQSQPALLLLARSYLQLGDGLAAEGALSRAAALHEPAARLAGLRARARFLQSDWPGAFDAAATAPGDGEAIRAAARARAMQGGSATAAQDLLAWLARAPRDAGAWTDLGRIRLDAGEIAAAADAATRAQRLAPGDPVALALQAEVVRTRYGPIAALPWFEAALARDAYYHPALIEYAATLGEVGRNVDMLAATRRALAARPGSPQAFYLQAVLAARAGRGALARDLLQRAGDAVADLPGAALLAGGLDYARGQTERAIGDWRPLAEDQPLNVSLRRLLGAALLRSGDIQGGLDQLRPIALRDDADAYTLTLVARGFEARGDRVAAARFLDRAAIGAHGGAIAFTSDDDAATLLAAARQAPGDPNYLLGVIRAQLAAGDTAGAIARARTLVAASPGAPAAQIALGDALAVSGRYADAAQSYARAASLSFDEPTMLRLVDAWGRADRPRDAAAALSLYLGQNPQSLVGRRLLGRLQVQGGDEDAAIETLEAVRRIAGNRDAALLADLALAYAGSDADGDGAVASRYGRAAYRLAPMNAAVCDAYAVALAAAGNLDGARQLAAKAVRLAPADPVIAAHARRIAA
ncbi:tetratricopeptide repeat protein [Sphingomonas sp. RIT328]|uniref:tetratricopeptide repeat protein n=1 Tax=Sphingomonas sp. RIT328 TaxID=1470591 RepID=UPI00044B8994|nr:tetratricopeptide repeat protein [Sphingomonas sp. RIT328]EZP54774.1 Tetratricopeptide repeat family protein [Sphingomonas sp. RIT328]